MWGTRQIVTKGMVAYMILVEDMRYNSEEYQLKVLERRSRNGQ